MSTLLQLLNQVRRSATVEWLTPAQCRCYEQLLAHGRLHNPAVLLGPPGSGKTFTGWLVRRALQCSYTANPHDIPAGSDGMLIIDNTEIAEVSARTLLGRAELCGWTSTLLIARALDPQGIPLIRLPAPSATDITACLARLLPHSSVAEGETNLWHALQQNLHATVKEASDDDN